MEISFLSFTLESSGNIISRLAPISWKIPSSILLDHAKTPSKGPP